MSKKSEPPDLIVDQAFAATGGKTNLWEPAYSGALSFMRRRYTKDFRGDAVDVVVEREGLELTLRPTLASRSER